jgi:hypothetical protein
MYDLYYFDSLNTFPNNSFTLFAEIIVTISTSIVVLEIPNVELATEPPINIVRPFSQTALLQAQLLLLNLN